MCLCVCDGRERVDAVRKNGLCIISRKFVCSSCSSRKIENDKVEGGKEGGGF